MCLAQEFNFYLKNLSDAKSEFEKIVKKESELSNMCGDVLDTPRELLPKNTYGIKGYFHFVGKQTHFEGYMVVEDDKLIGKIKEPYNFRDIEALITGVANKEMTEFYFVKVYGGMAVPIYYHAVKENNEFNPDSLDFDAVWTNNCDGKDMVSPKIENGNLMICEAEHANKAKIYLIKMN